MRPTTATWVVRGHRARRRLRGALALCAAVVLVAAGSIGAGRLWDRSPPTLATWREPAPGSGATAGVQPAAAPAVGPPTAVRIPAIGVDAPLVALHLDAAGALAAPTDYAVPGWYADGTPPGDVGPAVIAGHVDSRTGPAVFYRLHELRVGDRVEVARGGRWLAFRVLSTSRYPKDRFPTTRVYGPTPDRQLRLITCGGGFDQSRGAYLDNIVVFAVAT